MPPGVLGNASGPQRLTLEAADAGGRNVGKDRGVGICGG